MALLFIYLLSLLTETAMTCLLIDKYRYTVYVSYFTDLFFILNDCCLLQMTEHQNILCSLGIIPALAPLLACGVYKVGHNLQNTYYPLVFRAYFFCRSFHTAYWVQIFFLCLLFQSIFLLVKYI